MKTKVFVLLFVLMTNVIFTSAAVVEGTCGPNLTWSLNTKDSTLTIEGTGAMSDYRSYIGDAPWVNYRSYIAHLLLPEGLTYIGIRAFFACNKLNIITIPNSVISIGEEAFKSSSLIHVVFGNNSYRIGSKAFENCKSLITLENLKNATSIGSYAFGDCIQLTSVNLQKTIGVGDYAFYRCSNLTNIEALDSVFTIGEYAFHSCKKLQAITFPYKLTSIGKFAFYNCESLSAVIIPDCVTSIGDYAFIGCTGIRTLVIPNNVHTIGEQAFSGCSMYSVNIPQKLGVLESRTFSNCRNLEYIEIPSGIYHLGKQVFNGCTNLTSIIWNAKNATVNTTGDNKSLVYSPFNNIEEQITSITFGEEVRTIPNSLCSRMKNINNVVIPDSVKTIENSAFAGCNNLTHITIGSGIENIGSNAFGTVYMGSQVTQITELTIYAQTPPAGGLNCGINPAICTLYVPEESIEVYSNTLWWEDFLHIRAIGSTHTITFVDMDGTILSTQTFDEGETIIPPTTPQHEGYTFIGWDTDLTNITSDITITAQYTINRYRIQFIDWDGTIIKTDSVEYLSNIVPPANPTRIATAEFTYTFAGWTPKIVPVIGDATYTAQYNSIINKYTITFKNDDGSELCADEWDYGTMPYCEEPTKEDDEQYRYTFAGWSPDLVVVKADATYTATYTVTPKSQGIEDVLGEDVQCKKLVRDGHIYILRGDKTYTLQGQEVK